MFVLNVRSAPGCRAALCWRHDIVRSASRATKPPPAKKGEHKRDKLTNAGPNRPPKGRDSSDGLADSPNAASPLKERPKTWQKLNLAERVLLDRRVSSIKQIMHTAPERIRKQISTRTAHQVLPLSRKDDSSNQVRLLARSILLRHRERASLPLSCKLAVPPLTPVNGVGKFVLPLQRVLFTYCSHAKDSDGIRQYLQANLRSLATANPSVEFVVEPRWGHFPLIRGFFLQGREKVLCVKNYTVPQVHEAFMMLRNSSGAPLKRFRQSVKSTAPAVRPLWSPFHMLQSYKNNYLLPFTGGSQRRSFPQKISQNK